MPAHAEPTIDASLLGLDRRTSRHNPAIPISSGERTPQELVEEVLADLEAALAILESERRPPTLFDQVAEIRSIHRELTVLLQGRARPLRDRARPDRDRDLSDCGPSAVFLRRNRSSVQHPAPMAGEPWRGKLSEAIRPNDR